jgi:hypothetical protein
MLEGQRRVCVWWLYDLLNTPYMLFELFEVRRNMTFEIRRTLFPQCRRGNDMSVCGGGGDGGGVGKSLAALMFAAMFMLLVDGLPYPTINNTQPKFLRDLLLLLPCFFGILFLFLL